jgi:hypothetical protein
MPDATAMSIRTGTGSEVSGEVLPGDLAKVRSSGSSGIEQQSFLAAVRKLCVTD